jgi:hypothetical protein
VPKLCRFWGADGAACLISAVSDSRERVDGNTCLWPPALPQGALGERTRHIEMPVS